MFGTNSPAKVSSSLPVREIFATIQGEGPLTGTPSIFIRVGGCPLRCFFCDTDFNLNSSETFTPEALIERVEALRLATSSGPLLLVISGGEPLLYQYSLALFIRFAAEAGFRVQIETAGSIPIIASFENAINETETTVVLSPKTPALARGAAELATHWKYLVAHGRVSLLDGLPIFQMQINGPTDKPVPIARPPQKLLKLQPDRIFVQPLMEYVAADKGMVIDQAATDRNTDLAVNLALKYGYRLSIQTHKALGLR